MNIDQCPSTIKGENRKPSKAELAGTARTLGDERGSFGSRTWRSIDELADTPEFRDFLQREFPAGASELDRAPEGESRRDFLKIMGASVALAGAATIPGCRQPDHKILTYSKDVPEEVIPGRPLYYATSMPLPGGGAEGLLVETHEGRPTKIEGNPLHPVNRGKSSVWAQASVLGLYDPDRLVNPIFKNPTRGRLQATWDDFRTWAAEHFAKYDENKGEGLAFIVDKKTSPTRDAVKARLLQRWPKATWVSYDPVEAPAIAAGSAAAFGEPMRELLSLDKAKVIVSLDRDFVDARSGEPGGLVQARGFAATRLADAPTSEMSRLYVIESGFSNSGASADHRVRLAPSRISVFAAMLAQQVLSRKAQPGSKVLVDAVNEMKPAAGSDFDAALVDAVAQDLMDNAHKGAAVVVAGASQPAWVHALAHAMNAALGSAGTCISYLPMGEEEARSGVEQLKAIAPKLSAGEVSTLVTIGANPVYDAPHSLFGAEGFGAAYAKVGATVFLGVEASETAAASTWSLNGTHFLECWGDCEAIDGTVSPIQPMIAPLYDGAMSEIELLTLLMSDDRVNAKPDGHEIVRSVFQARLGADGFEKAWRRALQDGVVPGSTRTGDRAEINYAGLTKLVASAAESVATAAAPSAQSIEAVFSVSHVGDGRFANYAWLQELPEPGTRTVWDNPALMSPSTAAELGLAEDVDGKFYTEKFPAGRMASFTVGGKTVELPVWLLPGMADNTVIFTVGYGRRVAGRVAEGVGFDVYPLLPAGERTARAVKVERANGSYPISSTQNHWSMQDRTSIVRAADKPAWAKHGGEEIESRHEIYGTTQKLNFAERLGELSHTPPNIGAYDNPLSRSKGDANPANVGPDGKPPAFAVGPQWGMTIDLSTCTGCGTCTIACQAENNIPVVGKKEVQKGREMSWIRVDRYFTGHDMNNPDEMLHQPVACVHCENAPCETVCPVNATVHGPEGINYMTYNRCMGTRYCANNCPYKVRRFNFFEYGKLKFNGDYYGKSLVEKVAPERGGVNGSNDFNKININLIPPRLREKLDQIERMQKNPDVTVRMRGVMEKCSYCIQRINAARVESKLHNLPGIPDGFFQAACQQACPSNSIIFGDILDKNSAVAKSRASGRSYGLLGYLNTRPRTSYLLKVRNPNPRLVSDERRHSWEDPFHHGHDSHDHSQDEGGGHAFRFEKRRRAEDKGYALSLNVLGDQAGVHA